MCLSEKKHVNNPWVRECIPKYLYVFYRDYLLSVLFGHQTNDSNSVWFISCIYVFVHIMPVYCYLITVWYISILHPCCACANVITHPNYLLVTTTTTTTITTRCCCWFKNFAEKCCIKLVTNNWYVHIF